MNLYNTTPTAQEQCQLHAFIFVCDLKITERGLYLRYLDELTDLVEAGHGQEVPSLKEWFASVESLAQGGGLTVQALLDRTVTI